MISPELIRRYPFFAGLNHDQIVTLAKVGSTITVESGHHLFHEGDDLESFYLVVEGAAAFVVEVLDREAEHKLSDLLTGEFQTSEVVISAIGPGEIFGWSGLVPPHQATVGGKATTPCRLAVFDCLELRKIIDEDCQFGYLMIQKVASVIRERLRDMRIESLGRLVE